MTKIHDLLVPVAIKALTQSLNAKAANAATAKAKAEAKAAKAKAKAWVAL